MNGEIKKLKDDTGKYIYPITVGQAVFVEPNKTLTQKLSEIGSGGAVTLKKPWKGKVLNIHGDSNAASTTPELGLSYVDAVKQEHEFLTYNKYARSGYNMQQIYTDFITQNTSADLVIISGGGNIPPGGTGTINDTVTSTVYGALNNMVAWYFANMPHATLVIIGTSQVKSGMDGMVESSAGLDRKKRYLAMKEVAEKFSVPFINLWTDSGITAYNADYLTKDGTHPNALGYERQIALINKALYNVFPINY